MKQLWCQLLSAAAIAALGGAIATGAEKAGAARDYRARAPQDEIIYFLLPDRFENGDLSNDRGGLNGERLQTGYDPTHKGYYHGGDLRGLLARLDYIQSLGVTAIWLGPVYRNKPVQGPPGEESAGYHGYWITDFTTVDPHFGTAADMRSLVAAVHARGMKLYLDIIVNHTADVIRYRECPDNQCAYRSLANYPYARRGGVDGAPINAGFAGHGPGAQTAANFARLTRPDYAYTPYVPAGEEHVKVPDWLNDPIYYHNRGNSTFEGESSTLGDFSGLDDLMTENPRVMRGFIDIFGGWIDRYGIDGFRIDTARHVNPEFWQAFVPAMRARAAARGIPNFHIFGEVATGDVASLAEHTRVDRLPAVLDFGFAAAVVGTVAGAAGTDELAQVFAGDSLYEGGAAAALQLPTFVSNHDAGRFAMFAATKQPRAGSAELLQRTRLAHAMLLTLRGVPVIYSGDEQGFVGRGGDQDSRQDMFASQVASYNEQPLLGTQATTATSSFNTNHPLYRLIAELSKIRLAHPALLHGAQLVRAAGKTPGLFAVSRIDPATGGEILVAFNTSTSELDERVLVNASSAHFSALHGNCAATADAPGSYRIRLAPLDFAICAASAAP
jgi:glycosidase